MIGERDYCLFEVSGEELRFFRCTGGERGETGRVKVEWHYIAARFLPGELPGEGEIENAINFIEDELMKDPGLVNGEDLNLYTRDRGLAGLLGADGSRREFSREDIEEDFTDYALISMGRSPLLVGREMDRERYAALLVVREILNHLKFERLILDL